MKQTLRTTSLTNCCLGSTVKCFPSRPGVMCSILSTIIRRRNTQKNVVPMLLQRDRAHWMFGIEFSPLGLQFKFLWKYLSKMSILKLVLSSCGCQVFAKFLAGVKRYCIYKNLLSEIRTWTSKTLVIHKHGVDRFYYYYYYFAQTVLLTLMPWPVSKKKKGLQFALLKNSSPLL